MTFTEVIFTNCSNIRYLTFDVIYLIIDDDIDIDDDTIDLISIIVKSTTFLCTIFDVSLMREQTDVVPTYFFQHNCNRQKINVTSVIKISNKNVML